MKTFKTASAAEQLSIVLSIVIAPCMIAFWIVLNYQDFVLNNF